IWFMLAIAHGKQGARDEARKWYTAALVSMARHAPMNEELLRLRGEAAALLGLSEKATDLAPQAPTDDLQYFTLFLDADPRAAWAYQWRGHLHLSRRTFDQAALDFNKVLELTPLDPQAWYDRGRAHYCLKKYAEAVADYRKALDIQPTYVS